MSGWLATLKRPFQNRFLRNVGWLGAAQLLNRLVRLGTTVFVARLLSPSEYGAAALALTISEFINVFSRHGIGAKLIQAPAEDLPELEQAAYWLEWIFCGGLFVLQLALAWPLALVFNQPGLTGPIACLAFSYLLLPLAYIQHCLLVRANRLEVSAITNAVQLSLECVLSLVFALLGWGLWSLVLPKLLVVPVWVIFGRLYQPWTPPQAFTLQGWQELLRFARPLLGVELLATLRNNVDYLLVGRFLGVEALGVYYFAFNAGLGISLSLVQATSAALYPHLCEVATQPSQLRQRFNDGLRAIARFIVPVVLLQTVLAPFYVPLVFGRHWAAVGAIPVLMLICLSALPRPFAEAASQLLRAIDRPGVDLRWNLLFTTLLVLGLWPALQGGIVGVAAAVLAIHGLALPWFVRWVQRTVFTVLLTQSSSLPL